MVVVFHVVLVFAFVRVFLCVDILVVWLGKATCLGREHAVLLLYLLILMTTNSWRAPSR